MSECVCRAADPGLPPNHDGDDVRCVQCLSVCAELLTQASRQIMIEMVSVVFKGLGLMSVCVCRAADPGLLPDHDWVVPIVFNVQVCVQSC